MNTLPYWPSRFLLGAAAGATILWSADGLEARQSALIGGIVLAETTELPIAGATVSIESTETEMETETESREDGRFGYDEVPPGTVTVRVRAPDRAVFVEEVEVGANDIVFVRFFLPELTAVLSEIVGGAEASSPREARPADSNATALDLVESILPPGIQLVVGAQERAPRMRFRGENSLNPRGGPVVFIDGIRIGTLERALDALGQIPASHVMDVRVLRGPSAAFMQAFTADGSIQIRTRAEPGRPEPENPQSSR